MDIVQILLHPENADQNWKSTAKEILEAREMEECTFKPKINDYEPFSSRFYPEGSKQSNKSKRSAQEKCHELFLRAQNNRDKKDKTSEDFEYERNVRECTFSPNIGLSQKTLNLVNYEATGENGCYDFCSNGLSNTLSSQDTMTMGIKGFQQTMSRMKKGREDREKAQKMLNRGIPGTIQEESLLQPLHFSTNNNYKNTFSNYPTN